LQEEGMARGNFGERLKRERELREVTLQEITSATRIGTRFLEALENEDWTRLPGGVFNRGFVRAIARYLGLDEEGLLAEYDLAHGTKVPPAEERPEERIPSPPKWVPAAIVLGVVVLLAGLIAGGVYAWRYFAARRSLKQSEASSGAVFQQTARQGPLGAVLLELNGQAMPALGVPGSSGTMKPGRKDQRQATGGNSQP
jgi:cytoskeletal protein RodZ